MHELIELRRKRDAFLQTAQNVVGKAVTEARSLTPAESTDITGLREKAAAASETITQFEELRGLTSEQRGGHQEHVGGDGAAAGPFTSFGDQLRSVIDAGREGRQVDPRLYEVRAATGLNEKVGSDGGFLVQTSFSDSLLKAGNDAAKLAPRCNPFPLSGNSNGIELPMVDETSKTEGSRWGGLRLYWSDEAQAITASKPKFRKVELKLKKLTGGVYLTDEIIQDASVLENFVRAAFSQEFAFCIDDAILRANGSGRPLGILNSGALITVAKEVGQPAGSVATENITAMYSRSTNPEGSIWIANSELFPSLANLQVAAGASNAMVGLLKDGIATSPTGMALYGRPLLWVSQCSAPGTPGDLMFVDMSRYLLATKGGLQVANSIHVKFLEMEQVLRFHYRIDGQPDINTPITPAYGTLTRSPFIAIAAR